MSYYESAEGYKCSKERAKQEINSHNADWVEFVVDNGELEEYDVAQQVEQPQDVLAWLGY